ncbi:glycerophosphodiester phosphodiesterase [Clostridium sediminicola]|uniref:glycerophosphodiester phosphodiesterase n=1 Tax=Clostridium sediminicola TaxID=3114879 RepID=UPI0031F25BD9
MVKIYAHRGASGEYPENTMIAFKKAIELGADGIETDVQMTKDGELVLIHDETVNRTTNGKGLIKDYRYCELEKLDAGSWLDERYRDAKIPRLEDLFELVKDSNVVINIELKNNIIIYKNLEQKVIHMIEKYNMTNRVIISSFNHYAIKKCIEINKNIETGLLYTTGLYKPEFYAEYVGSKNLHPYYYAVYNEQILKGIKAKGIKVNIFTVNNESDMEFFVKNNVDGIITNFPKKLKRIIKSFKTEMDKIL